MYKLCACVLTESVYAKIGICGVRLSRSSIFRIRNAQKNVLNYSWTEPSRIIFCHNSIVLVVLPAAGWRFVRVGRYRIVSVERICVTI